MTANSLASKTAQGEEHFDFLFAIWLIPQSAFRFSCLAGIASLLG
jgi:hypothetical protein